MRYLMAMPRLSIDITPEEHQKLKAIAALKGESIKDFVLKRTLGDAPALDDMSEAEAVAALADFLKQNQLKSSGKDEVVLDSLQLVKARQAVAVNLGVSEIFTGSANSMPVTEFIEKVIAYNNFNGGARASR